MNDEDLQSLMNIDLRKISKIFRISILGRLISSHRNS